MYLYDTPLQLDPILGMAEHRNCGALDVFAGTVRDHNEGKRVLRLKYTAFAPLAEKLLLGVCGDDRARWHDATQAAEVALAARMAFWDGLASQLALGIGDDRRCRIRQQIGDQDANALAGAGRCDGDKVAVGTQPKPARVIVRQPAE